MLDSAWDAVSTETIVNFFRKAGISTANQEVAIADEDDSFKDLQNKINALRNIQPDLLLEDVNTASVTDVDGEVSAVQPPIAHSEILAEFFETGNISDVDDKVMDISHGLEEEPMEYHEKSDLLIALEVIKKFSLLSTNGETVKEDCLKIERNID